MVPGETAGDGLIRLARPDVGEAELAAVAEVLETGWLTMGPKVGELEAGLARACEVEHALAVSSGTAALHLALLALGVGEGDEVIVPAYTFPATANTVVFCGAKPVLADVDPHTFNVDPAAVRAKLTPRTKAIVAVHLFGRPAPVEELPGDVPILEDAAGALGARRAGRACGGLGALGCLSFHPRKIVTTGEGGAVTTNDAELAERVRRARNHGWVELGTMPAPGLNYRLADVLCALGIPQVARLDELLAARARIAAGYDDRLRDVVRTPGADEGDVHGWQAYVVATPRRDEALAALRARSIEAQIGTFALHRLDPYRDQGDFPGAAEAEDRALALPLHSQLTDADLDRVAAVLREL